MNLSRLEKKNEGWIIIELGDGQVAGLPDNADGDRFYNLKDFDFEGVKHNWYKLEQSEYEKPL